MQRRDRRAAAAKHPLDLVVPALLQRDDAGVLRKDLEPGRPAHPILQRNALGKAGHHFFGQRKIHRDPVPLGDVPFRRENLVRQRPVVGQDHQTGRILIQPACREQPLAPVLRRHQLQHRFIPGIPRGGNVAPGLMQHQGQRFLHRDRQPVHSNRFLPADLALRALFHAAFHRHPARGDKFPHLPAGEHPLRRQQLVQPFHGIRPLSCPLL